MFNKAIKKVNIALLIISLIFTTLYCPAMASETLEDSMIAYAMLGEKIEASGMNVFIGDDKDSVNTAIIAGKEAWILDPAKQAECRYIYVDINKDNLYNLDNGINLEVSVEYFDDDKLSTLTLEYEKKASAGIIDRQSSTIKAASTEVTELDFVEFKGTGQWKTHTWFVPAATLRDALNSADLRIGVYGNTMKYSLGGKVYVSSITVSKPGNKGQIEIKDNLKTAGNIFYTGEIPEIDFSISNKGYPYYSRQIGRYDAMVKFTAFDDTGKVIYTEEKKVNMKPMSEQTVSFEYKPEKYGLYTYTTEIYNTEKKLYNRVSGRFSYLASLQGEQLNPKCGINITTTSETSQNAEILADIVMKTGFSSARRLLSTREFTDGLYDKYKVSGIGAWTGFTEGERQLKNRGIEVTAYLEPVRGVETTWLWGPNQEYYIMPQDEAGYRRYAEQYASIIEKYGDTIDRYGICNETDYNIFNINYKDPASYANLIKFVYPYLKQRFPDKTFEALNASAACQEGGENQAFLEGYFAEGAGSLGDVISFHPYRKYMNDENTFDYPELADPAKTSGTYGYIKFIRRLQEEYGTKKLPLIASELGDTVFAGVWTKTEKGQAVKNVIDYFLVNSAGADHIQMFKLNNSDTDNRTEAQTNYGMILGSKSEITPFAAKPSLGAFSFINTMYDLNHKDIFVAGDKVQGWLYERTEKGTEVLILATEDEHRKVFVDLGVNEVTLYDIYGNPTELSSTDGTYMISVSEDVKYIEGNFEKCEIIEKSAVYPKLVNLDMPYNSKAELEIVNTTKKSLNAECIVLEGSSIECSCDDFTDDGTITFKLGDTGMMKSEPVRLRLTDSEDNVYFDGDIYITNAKINVKLETALTHEKIWKIRNTVTNDSSFEVGGIVRALTPSDAASVINDEFITLAAGEQKEVFAQLPLDKISDGEMMQFAFIPDGKENDSIYTLTYISFNSANKDAVGITIDGDLSEWNTTWNTLNMLSQYSVLGENGNWNGPDDISMKYGFQWDEEYLYIGVIVTDEKHVANQTGVNMWQTDSIQFAITGEQSVENTSVFTEIGAAFVHDKAETYRWKYMGTPENPTVVEGEEIKAVQNGTETTFEWKIPWKTLIPDNEQIVTGDKLYVSLLYNDCDGKDRDGYIFFGQGIGNGKNNMEFKELYLIEE